MLHYRYRSVRSTCGLYRTRYMYVYVVVLLIINVCYVKSYPLILILFIPIRDTGTRVVQYTQRAREKNYVES